MATVIEKLVRRYACSVCHRSWSKRSVAAAHAARCAKDPTSRACGTCRHDFEGPNELGCGIGARPDDVRCVWQCPQWEPLPIHVTNQVDVVVRDRTDWTGR